MRRLWSLSMLLRVDINGRPNFYVGKILRCVCLFRVLVCARERERERRRENGREGRRAWDTNMLTFFLKSCKGAIAQYYWQKFIPCGGVSSMTIFILNIS